MTSSSFCRLLFAHGILIIMAALCPSFAFRQLRMCFQCHMPYTCSSGLCFGDYCVKSLVADKYVSKGCENRSIHVTFDSHGLSRNALFNQQQKLPDNAPVGCVQTFVFGQNNTICHCHDRDFCNDSQTPSPFSLMITITISISCVLFSIIYSR